MALQKITVDVIPVNVGIPPLWQRLFINYSKAMTDSRIHGNDGSSGDWW